MIEPPKKSPPRLTWDEFFILLATIYSSRGTCDRLRTGTILVKDSRIVGAGYNGSISGTGHCDEVGHLMVNNHCLRTLHSEQNAIHNAIADLSGATAYMVAAPCVQCVKGLLQRGVRRVVFISDYDNSKGHSEVDDYVAELCREKGVSYECVAKTAEYTLAILNKAITRLKGPGGAFEKLGKDHSMDNLL